MAAISPTSFSLLPSHPLSSQAVLSVNDALVPCPVHIFSVSFSSGVDLAPFLGLHSRSNKTNATHSFRLKALYTVFVFVVWISFRIIVRIYFDLSLYV